MNAAIINVGTMVSGDIENDVLEADAIRIEDGKIRVIGTAEEIDANSADLVVDANGTTLVPGLIDSHTHPVLLMNGPIVRDMHLLERGKSRLQVSGWLEASMHAGITSMISAGELTISGRGRTPVAAKELAIAARHAFTHLRYGGVKLHGGSVFLEKGMTESDFQEMAAQGVWLVAEVGLGSAQTPEEVIPLVDWARKNGMMVLMHTGGPSLKGSKSSGADEIIAIQPDVVCHINGGTTGMSMESIRRLIEETDLTLELVYIGNPKLLADSVVMLAEKGDLHRVICGSDGPGGVAYSPQSVLQTVRNIACLTDIPPAKAVAMATGNTARVFGLNTGKLEVGREADLVLMDAPSGSVGQDAMTALAAGDIPAIPMVMIDGEIVAMPGKFTPDPNRQAVLTKGATS